MKFFEKKYLVFLFAILLTPSFVYSQNAILIFNEDFETGISPFIADSSFSNPVGINSWIDRKRSEFVNSQDIVDAEVISKEKA